MLTFTEKTLQTDIVDTNHPEIETGRWKAITRGLGLKVEWENTVSHAIIIPDIYGDSEPIDVSVNSAVSKGYTTTVMSPITGSWNIKNKIHDITGSDSEVINSIKNMRYDMNYQDLCQVLNHAQAWNYCVQKEHPVIIIEAGTVLNTRVQKHIPRNSIINLTNKPLKQVNENWHSFQGVECYCVDQFVSRKLLAMLYTQGIRDKLSTIIRDDLFCIW